MPEPEHIADTREVYDHSAAHYADVVGTEVSHHSVDSVVDSLGASGFEVRARVWREAELEHETTPQAFITARRRGTHR